ncbi:hypothetical protein Psi01_44890 [Planobispora siamensis]|uniref:Uncharacterized protein n=1 Tax=Planobispora siamensis TaxID=936338 RepID=A0A8J3WK97_9ACTN|nr:hypothetical protein Psi01_44890 [Planobispora siamensis]
MPADSGPARAGRVSPKAAGGYGSAYRAGEPTPEASPRWAGFARPTLTAATWHDRVTGRPVTRSLIAYATDRTSDSSV